MPRPAPRRMKPTKCQALLSAWHLVGDLQGSSGALYAGSSRPTSTSPTRIANSAASVREATPSLP